MPEPPGQAACRSSLITTVKAPRRGQSSSQSLAHGQQSLRGAFAGLAAIRVRLTLPPRGLRFPTLSDRRDTSRRECLQAKMLGEVLAIKALARQRQ
jgi:hypothetical protein